MRYDVLVKAIEEVRGNQKARVVAVTLTSKSNRIMFTSLIAYKHTMTRSLSGSEANSGKKEGTNLNISLVIHPIS